MQSEHKGDIPTFRSLLGVDGCESWWQWMAKHEEWISHRCPANVEVSVVQRLNSGEV